jgi:hypothetical protein
LRLNPRGDPARAEVLNVELARATVYNLVEQQAVTGWLALRNKAAHGAYDAYDRKQVEQMLDGVREFIGRHPA